MCRCTVGIDMNMYVNLGIFGYRHYITIIHQTPDASAGLERCLSVAGSKVLSKISGFNMVYGRYNSSSWGFKWSIKAIYTWLRIDL